MQHSSNSPEVSSLNGLSIYSKQGQQDLLALHKRNPERYPFLLESVANTIDIDDDTKSCSSRFDILFAFPKAALTLDNRGRLAGPGASGSQDFLSALNGWWQHEHMAAKIKL